MSGVTGRFLRVQRVSIVGSSGSGKSTLAKAVAERIGATHVELDAMFHQADWQPTPTAELRRNVAAALDSERWVVCGNYSKVADLVQGGADTIIWLDLSRRLVMSRLIRRSVKRAITREELWNGNRESWRNLFSRDPERNVVLWAWRHHDQYRKRYEGFAAGKFWAHADVHRLRTRADVKQFIG